MASSSSSSSSSSSINKNIILGMITRIAMIAAFMVTFMICCETPFSEASAGLATRGGRPEGPLTQGLGFFFFFSGLFSNCRYS